MDTSVYSQGMNNQANDNQPLARGDQVQLLGFPFTRGVVWDFWKGRVGVAWEDPEQELWVERRWLEKVTPVAAPRLVP
jgi:hypothetical protein